MSMILRKILEKMEKVDSATSLYSDDIIVNETEVMVEEVVAHLRKFGLIAKFPESLDGGAALGLRLKWDKRGKLQFRRGNEIPQMKEELAESARSLGRRCGSNKLLRKSRLQGAA